MLHKGVGSHPTVHRPASGKQALFVATHSRHAYVPGASKCAPTAALASCSSSSNEVVLPAHQTALTASLHAYRHGASLVTRRRRHSQVVPLKATLDDPELAQLVEKLDAMQPELPQDRPKLQKALATIDELNSQDPSKVEVDGVKQGYRLVYSKWLTDWVKRLEPKASDELLILARGKSVEGWKLSNISRNDYAPNSSGQQRWLKDRRTWMAERLKDIMKDAGYGEASLKLVYEVMMEKGIPYPKDIRTYDLQGPFGLINFRLLEQVKMLQVLNDAETLVFLDKSFPRIFEQLPADEVLEMTKKELQRLSERGISEVIKKKWTPVERKLLMKVLPAPSRFKDIMQLAEGRAAASTHPGDWRFQNYDYD